MCYELTRWHQGDPFRGPRQPKSNAMMQGNEHYVAELWDTLRLGLGLGDPPSNRINELNINLVK